MFRAGKPMSSLTINTQLLFSCGGGLGYVDQVSIRHMAMMGGVCITSKAGWRIVLETQTLSSWSVVGSPPLSRAKEYCCRVVGFIIFCVALAH